MDFKFSELTRSCTIVQARPFRFRPLLHYSTSRSKNAPESIRRLHVHSERNIEARRQSDPSNKRNNPLMSLNPHFAKPQPISRSSLSYLPSHVPYASILTNPLTFIHSFSSRLCCLSPDLFPLPQNFSFIVRLCDLSVLLTCSSRVQIRCSENVPHLF